MCVLGTRTVDFGVKNAVVKFFPADATNQGRSSLGKKSKMPPLLVQRCSGTTAELSYLEVGSWLVSALSTPNGGEGYNSSTDFNPYTISSIQLQCIQAESPHLGDKTTGKPQQKCCMYKSLLINLHAVCLYEINIQKGGIGHQILK